MLLNNMRRKKDSDGFTIYVQEGEGIFDTFMDVGKKVLEKVTSETSKKIAKKAAEKIVEKGSEKIGTKMGELASNKLEKIITKPKSVERPKTTNENEGEQIISLLKNKEEDINPLSSRFDLLLM